MIEHPEDQLSAYLDDELNAEERQRVEDHIEECESCQALLEDLLVMQSELAQTFRQIQEPAHLEVRVLQSISEEKIPTAAEKGWAFGFLMMVLTFGIFWFLSGSVLVKLIHGLLKLTAAMVYAASHFILSVPVLTGLTVVLSSVILAVSAYSLRRLLQTTAN
ncbi:anti-sigma factor family protein [Paenibacillus zanthoxyli]|uniref:anti-sigma factor family protein n=1 Tax=Paenibacillus zanthoxyli TaxID=369399 RepID=UPI00046FCAAB|nr:zf-HC2 domain-containing protein [Paenibacillus zanthoxyli]